VSHRYNEAGGEKSEQGTKGEVVHNNNPACDRDHFSRSLEGGFIERKGRRDKQLV